MAHWFHRNVLKATTSQKFELKIANPTDVTRKLCSELRQSRVGLLYLIRNANYTSDRMESAFHNYLSLLYGFLWEIYPSEETECTGIHNPSKLRNVFLFKWTHTLLGQGTFSSTDSIYEAANMCINVGLWFMKHTAMIAAKDEITINEAKEVHNLLRQAAGIFTFVQTELLPQLANPPPLGSDLDPRVLNAYTNQCIAEAQEVTVARAVELKHNSSLISALANETSELFLDAANTLRSFKVEISGQWIKYLEFKSAFYLSYAYIHCGENLLTMDKCGEAIRAMQESDLFLTKAKALCQEYKRAHGFAPHIMPDQHPVFKRLTLLLKLTFDKCNREDSLIYHHMISREVPALDIIAPYGLSPIDFQMPLLDSIWRLNMYKIQVSVAAAKMEKEQNLPLVQEERIYQSSKKPNNLSGCVLQ